MNRPITKQNKKKVNGFTKQGSCTRRCQVMHIHRHPTSHEKTHTHTHEQYTTLCIISVYNQCCCSKIKFWI